MPNDKTVDLMGYLKIFETNDRHQLCFFIQRAKKSADQKKKGVFCAP
jgi:hypothetical protein